MGNRKPKLTEAAAYAAYVAAKQANSEEPLCIEVWRHWDAALKQIHAARRYRSSTWIDASVEAA